MSLPGRIGYCTNVHAGATLEQTLANLETHATAVRRLVSPGAPMGLGLWLSAPAAGELTASRRLDELASFLETRGLRAITLNGFPYGDFHGPVVKHDVYRPSWYERPRVEYTKSLATILARLLGPGASGSISTLPVAWPTDPGEPALAAKHLRQVVEHLDDLEARTGRHVHVDLEPEPGCVLGESRQLVEWFERHLLGGPDDARLRRYLGVCHDVCHGAVMYEDQRAVIERYRAAGLGIGKVQVSSAVCVKLEGLDADGRRTALEALGRFREPRYLHQTVIRRGETRELVDDLPEALAAHGDPGDPARAGDEWRVHFHVPIHLERVGPPGTSLGTSRGAILECLAALGSASPDAPVLEAETYAWDVLPEALRPATLAEGIAEELLWLRRQVDGAAPT